MLHAQNFCIQQTNVKGSTDAPRFSVYRQFQHRQLHAETGLVQPVLTHAELVEYLLDRSSGSKEYLPFEGMNQVVYRHMPPSKSGT